MQPMHQKQIFLDVSFNNKNFERLHYFQLLRENESKNIKYQNYISIS